MKNSSIEGAFRFWCPISKATESVIDPTTGEPQMVLGGIASTADEDSDGEFLDPKGFDIKPLLESGLVNWHHQAKGAPATIIGEPRVAEIRKNGLYIETVLYPSSKIAHDVWELAQTLEKDSKTRRLGYSIEGKVLKRKSDNPNDPGYKHISKAVITGVAITHMPKNPKTFANIIKGEIDDDEDFEEAEETTGTTEDTGMDTKRGKALMRESVDKRMKRVTFGKAEVFERLFKDIPGIAIQKASQIYSLIDKIAHMKNKKTISEEDIQKAYEALGLEIEPATDEVSKGDACGGSEKVLSKGKKKAEDAEEEEYEETEETVEEEETEKGCGDGDGGSKKTLKKAKKAEDAEETEEEEETEETEEEETEDVKKGGINRFDRLEKAIATSHQLNSKSIRAVGVLIKGLTNELHSAQTENAELRDLIKGQSDEINELREAINEFGAQVPARKSVTSARVVERQFAKSNETDIEKGHQEEVKGVSMSRQPQVVAEILDQATFAKGYDDEMSKACMSFEANHVLPANIIKRLKSEFGVEIVK